MKTVGIVKQLGLDGHRKFSILVGRDAQGRIALRERLEHKDRQEMRRRLERYPQGTPVVLEASFGWGWLSDQVQQAGLSPQLASTAKVAAWRKARGIAKSNRTDADLLSELPSEKQTWWQVWLAPAAVRSQREWLRYRMGMVKMQTMLKNRIHATLHRHGILHDYSDLFGIKGRRFLSLLVSGGDESLPASGRDTLKGMLTLLDQVRRLIAQATRMCRKIIQVHPAARRLLTLPGIGWVLAYTIIAEIGCIERFGNAGKLTAYSLLAPLADDSGEVDDGPPIGRHVGHAGRRTLKWAFIEAAHAAVRKDARLKAIFDRRTDGGKRDKNRGYIAVGHELCKLTHTLWRKDVDYDPAGTIRPGTRSSCSAMGQPDHPMIPVE